MASLDAVVSRLEAIAARLERLEGASGLSSPVAGSADTSLDNCSSAGLKAIRAFEEYMNSTLPAFVAASKALPDLTTMAETTEAAWKNQLEFVKATGVSKKPTDQQILDFLKPSADCIEKSGNMNFKSPSYTFQQAFNASVPVLSYPLLPNGAVDYIEGMIDSGNMYLDRILVKAKDLPEAEKQAHRTWVSSYKALLKGLFEFVKAHYKLGITWNPKGNDFTAYKSGSGAAPTSAPAPVAAPTPAAQPTKAAAGNSANVFAELSKGLDITKGLNKVTDDMKTKNMKDAPAKAPVVKAPAPKKDNLPAITKPPVFEYKGANWYIENQQDNTTLKVENAKMQDGIYIGNCRNCTVVVTGKPKSVAFDKCFRVTVQVVDVLSSVEFVNCDRSTVFINGVCPTIAVDKSKGIILNLSEKALAQNPDIITSNISECNIQVPGANEDEHIFEMPLPEQYITKINGRELTTNCVKHG